MPFFDWVFKQRFESEKEFLRALLAYAQAWYNEVTKPLEPLLLEIETGKTIIKPQKYAGIAYELYRNKIEVNSANYVTNTLEQMGKRGIPFFTSRGSLERRIQSYLECGGFIKDLGTESFVDWETRSEEAQRALRQQVKEGWERFRQSRRDLESEVNRQLGRLG